LRIKHAAGSGCKEYSSFSDLEKIPKHLTAKHQAQRVRVNTESHNKQYTFRINLILVG